MPVAAIDEHADAGAEVIDEREGGVADGVGHEHVGLAVAVDVGYRQSVDAQLRVRTRSERRWLTSRAGNACRRRCRSITLTDSVDWQVGGRQVPLLPSVPGRPDRACRRRPYPRFSPTAPRCRCRPSDTSTSKMEPAMAVVEEDTDAGMGVHGIAEALVRHHDVREPVVVQIADGKRAESRSLPPRHTS